MTSKSLIVVTLGLATLLAAHQVAAEPLVDHSAGLKLFAGADVWTSPSNPPGGSDGLGFVGSAGGIGYGVAGYYEFRIIKLVGLEADLAYQHGSFHRNVTSNGVAYTETMTTKDFRLPILAKLSIPLALGRMWVGLGPEFTLTQSSSAKVEPTTPVYVPATRDVKPTYGTLGLGLVVELPAIGIDIPFEFRASKNLAQPSAWADRASADLATQSVTFRAESSWVFRLGAGIGYRF